MTLKVDIFNKFMERSIDREERAREQIKNITRQAKKQGIDVRWYSKEQENGLTFYDPIASNEPSSNKAWCVFEKHDVTILREYRPKTILRNVGKGEKEYLILLNKYKHIWENFSRTPADEEYKN